MMKKFFILFFIAATLYTLTGCGETGVTPGNTVSGQVVFDVGVASNVKVTIGNQSAMTDSDGRFKINNVEFPYDISVLYFNDDYLNIYKGLSNANPVLSIGDNAYAPESNLATIFAQFPIPPISSSDALIHFKPDNNIPIISYPDHTTQSIKVYYDAKLDSMPGKLIVLYRNFIQQSYYLYYESGSIDITNANSTYVVQIDSSEFNLDPDERILNANIQSPMGSSFQLGYKLEFSNYPPLGYPSITSGMSSGNNISMPVPENISLPFIPYFFIQQYTANGDAQGFFKYTEGGDNNFQFHSAPTVITPSANDSVSLYNSVFKWAPSDGEGVYRVILVCNNGSKIINVYTASTDITFPNLNNLGFEPFEFGNDFRLNVYKYFYFSGMDDFVSKNFKYNGNYKSSSRSEDINFTLY